MKPKPHSKEGSKYLYIGPPSRWFGTEILWAENIKDFRVFSLNEVSEGNALLLKSVDNKIIRIHRNGSKYYR